MAKTVKSEQKQGKLQTELAKRDVLRLNNQESNELTRECIDMALMYLMSEKPFESISISEITKRAGVSGWGQPRAMQGGVEVFAQCKIKN